MYVCMYVCMYVRTYVCIGKRDSAVQFTAEFVERLYCSVEKNV